MLLKSTNLKLGVHEQTNWDIIWNISYDIVESIQKKATAIILHKMIKKDNTKSQKSIYKNSIKRLKSRNALDNSKAKIYDKNNFLKTKYYHKTCSERVKTTIGIYLMKVI